MKDLTIRERAAIALYLTDDKVSTADLYIAAHHKSAEEVAGMKSLYSAASHWLNSKPVQDYIRTQRLRQEDQRREERESVKSEILSQVHAQNENITLDGIIDYSDQRNRERLYNQVIANSKDDPKTQLDAAKMFEQIQKDNREAASTHQKQVRYYLPLRCESCVLYRKAKEAREKHVQ